MRTPRPIGKAGGTSVALPGQMLLALLLALAPSLTAEAVSLFGNGAPLFLARWSREAHALGDPAAARFVARRIAENLQEKREDGFALEEGAAERTVLGYELFKYRAYVASGVFPKRFFGYVDLANDTAPLERELRDTARIAVARINAEQERTGARVRITEMEVVVTFLAEGGAILLREKQDEANRVHPVLGVGLDDIAHGFAAKDAFVRALDAELGTRLAATVVRFADGPRLARFLTFAESVAATALMWVWEKEIAERKLRENRVDLMTLPADEQFIVASLVYNSGLVFTPERVRQIRDFATGAYLDDVSRANARKRWPLPVRAPAAAREQLLLSDRYPEQPTSWSAVYHVLQRWGAWVALRRFTDVFDERGTWRAEHAGAGSH